MPGRQEIPISSIVVEMDLLSARHLNYLSCHPPAVPARWQMVTVTVFGLWRVCFTPCLVRPGRRLPVQGLSEGSLGYLDRLPA